MTVEPVVSSVMVTLLREIYRVIKKKRNVTKEELQKLRRDVTKLVRLSQQTNYALAKYVELEESATRAGVHARELKRFLDDESSPKASLLQSLDVLDNERLVRLVKGELRQIYEYRKDYDEATTLTEDARKHLRASAAGLREDNRKLAGSELGYCVEKLDDLVKLMARRRDELLKPLSRAYETLASSEKRGRS